MQDSYARQLIETQRRMDEKAQERRAFHVCFNGLFLEESLWKELCKELDKDSNKVVLWIVLGRVVFGREQCYLEDDDDHDENVECWISYSTSGLSLGLQASDELGCCEIGLHSCKMMKMPKEECRIDPQQFMAMYDRRWQGCTRSKSNQNLKKSKIKIK